MGRKLDALRSELRSDIGDRDEASMYIEKYRREKMTDTRSYDTALSVREGRNKDIRNKRRRIRRLEAKGEKG